MKITAEQSTSSSSIANGGRWWRLKKSAKACCNGCVDASAGTSGIIDPEHKMRMMLPSYARA